MGTRLGDSDPEILDLAKRLISGILGVEDERTKNIFIPGTVRELHNYKKRVRLATIAEIRFSVLSMLDDAD